MFIFMFFLPIGQSGWDDVSDDIAADQSEYVVLYIDLEQSQSYVFRIMAENAISVSEPAITEQFTAPGMYHTCWIVCM